MLRTPEEWSRLKGYYIKDPDGWRTDDAPPWSEPVSEAEFLDRSGSSTIVMLNKVSYQDYLEACLNAKSENYEWRVGQTMSNVLHTHRRDLWRRVHHAGIDPFQQDKFIPFFLTFVKEHW